jgi:hypothetical protein
MFFFIFEKFQKIKFLNLRFKENQVLNHIELNTQSFYVISNIAKLLKTIYSKYNIFV